MSVTLGPQPRVRPVFGPFIVKEVRAFVIGDKATEEAAGGGADCHSQAHGHVSRARARARDARCALCC